MKGKRVLPDTLRSRARLDIAIGDRFQVESTTSARVKAAYI